MRANEGNSRVFDGGANMNLDQFFTIASDPSVDTLNVGGIDYARAKFQLSLGNVVGTAPAVTWVSNNPAIATVDANGLVTSVATGEVEIAAIASGFTAYYKVAAYYEPANPDITITSQDRVLLVPSVTVNYSSSGINYRRIDPDIYNDRYQLAVTNMTGTPVWSSSNTSVATINSSTGLVTGAANGTSTITVTNGVVSKTKVLSFNRTNQGTPTIVSYDAGTLRKAIEDFFVSRLGSNPNPATAKPIFSTQNHTAPSYVRNTSCWMANFDALTCCSPWNSTGGSNMAGTLITPRHILFANHYQINTGATVRFVTMDNVVVDRVMTGKAVVNGDCMLGVLASDVPATIKFAKMFPSSYATKLPVLQKTPCLRLDQEEKALVGSISIDLGSFFDSLEYPNYSESIIGGDSGNPIFVPFADNLVLISTFTSSNGGPNLTTFRTQIDSAIASLDSSQGYNTGYTCTVVDLSSYTTF